MFTLHLFDISSLHMGMWFIETYLWPKWFNWPSSMSNVEDLIFSTITPIIVSFWILQSYDMSATGMFLIRIHLSIFPWSRSNFQLISHDEIEIKENFYHSSTSTWESWSREFCQYFPPLHAFCISVWLWNIWKFLKILLSNLLSEIIHSHAWD